MHYGTEMKESQFGVKRSKVKVTVELSMLETALSGLVNTKSISWIFTKLTPMMYYGTEMSGLNFGSKDHSSRSRWNNVCWNDHCIGGGIQYSTYTKKSITEVLQL